MRLRRRVFRVGLLILASFITVILVTFASSSYLVQVATIYKVTTEARSEMRKVKSKFSAMDTKSLLEEQKSKYDNILSDDSLADGDPGNGLNLLLMDRIPVEGYIKELLQLYRDSSEGKLDNEDKHPAFETLLGIHYNESSYYQNTSILKSYLPVVKGQVQWKISKGSSPAEAMTLRNLNRIAANGAGIDYNYNGITATGSQFKNVFQIAESYFSNAHKSNLNGFKEGSNRFVDPMYLPDSLAYMSYNWTRAVNTVSLDDYSEEIKAAIFAVWHNGGEGTAQYFGSLGVTNPDRLKYYSATVKKGPERDSQKNYMAKQVSVLPETMIKTLQSKGPNVMDSVDKGYGVALWALLDNGYYLSNKLYNSISSGGTSSYLVGQLVKGYSSYYGKQESASTILSVLKSKTGEIWDIYPGYISASEVATVYGNSQTFSAMAKGSLWKLEDETSDVYKNKVKGNNPRILRRTNLEISGFIADAALSGQKVYKSMLMNAGITDDVTNPRNLYKENGGGFTPPVGDFAKVMDKIGAKIDDPQIYAMLEEAYRVSGHWYRYGAKGQFVTSSSWAELQSMAPANNKVAASHARGMYDIFKTKDGTDPSKAYNRRDSNLVAYNKQVFDCSGLVYWAYTNTIGKSSGKSIPRGSSGQLTSNLLTTLDRSKDEAKAGDLLVMNGHVFFFLAPANGESISPSESKTNKSYTAIKPYMWTLEASSTGTVTGIHATKADSRFKLRRFKL
jgi:cell wall-associated NlpC family hydrolase